MIGYVIYHGIKIWIRPAGTSEVQAIDGSRQLVVHLEAVCDLWIPPPPDGPGEPVEIPRAA